MRKLAQLVVLGLMFSATNCTSALTIVAAANVKPAMDSIVAQYLQLHPESQVQVIYGASGTIYQQITNDAPFDLFFSADMQFPQKLKDKGYVSAGVKCYATGQLALWSLRFDVAQQKESILADPSLHTIAIANPQTAPYGEKAVECLKFYNRYESLKDKLVIGESIAQAAQFVSTQAADIGFVAYSLIASLKTNKGYYYILPENTHQSLSQGCVVLKHAQGNVDALRFYDFISDKKVQSIFHYFGYL